MAGNSSSRQRLSGTSSLPVAAYWKEDEDNRIQCLLCPHHCRLSEGQAGLCRVRRVEGKQLRAASYGLVSAANVDPVEKKPLYHFHPGAAVYSLGSWGCNFACNFCQNWTISQRGPEAARRYSPDDILESVRVSRCRLVAYTYNEPLVGFEFVRDCSRRVRADGRKNILVTNGCVETEPAAELLALTDALNVDIKSIEPEFYRRQCRGPLEPVLHFCRQAVEAGCHLEITNLLIPTLNDSPESVNRLAAWVRQNLGEKTPLHLSAYRPEFQSRIPPTPVETLEKSWEIARQHLRYVYIGNVISARGQDTRCPACDHLLVERRGYSTRIRGLEGTACAKCGRRADLVLS